MYQKEKEVKEEMTLINDEISKVEVRYLTSILVNAILPI